MRRLRLPKRIPAMRFAPGGPGGTVSVRAHLRRGRVVRQHTRKRVVRRGPGYGAGVTHFGLHAGGVGDFGERLFEQHVVPKLFRGAKRIAHAPKPGGGFTTRTSALDFRFGKVGIELKTLSSQAANLKTAIKRGEILRKRAARRALGLTGLMTVAQVVNQRAGTVSVHSIRGIRSVTVKRMRHVGTFRFRRRR